VNFGQVSPTLPHLLKVQITLYGSGSSVGIVTDYGLESKGKGRFLAPVQTGPGAHPASCTMGTGSFLGVKGYTCTLPFGPWWPVIR
jgi:hypothetical protein